tara:strand:- start:7148 stop:7435 length:288 start_codon:yes stop_codon:yes gene_type:complete
MFGFNAGSFLAQEAEPPRMHSPSAHMAAQGARLRIKGAKPTAVSQSQFRALPPPMVAKPTNIRVWRRDGMGIENVSRPLFDTCVIGWFVLLRLRV